ncbi:MAG TPA: VanZ family protein [bacterium]|nr:VanZ family protein [bacterium]
MDSAAEMLPDHGRPSSATAGRAVAAWAALILVLSVIHIPSGLPKEFAFLSFDTLAHASFYAVLGALLFWALPQGNRITKLIIAAAAALIFGFIIELIQRLLPWRSFEWKDALSDLTGGAAGAVFALLFPRLHLFKLTK